MKRVVAAMFSALLATVAFTGCGGDDGTGPGDGNGGEKVILSAATSDRWTCHFFIHELSTFACAGGRVYESERIGDFWIPGGFRVVTQALQGNDDCCEYEEKRGTITSGKIDLSGYETVRLKAYLKFYEDHWASGTYAEVHATLYSNVPNTPDLVGVIDEHFVAKTGLPTLIEKDINVSLENAIGYKEATIALQFEVIGGCGGYLLNDLSIEVGNFRIVGTR